MTENILQLENIYKNFQVGETEVPCLKGIALKIERGSFLVINGPSGSGKSTLLSIIAGLEPPTSGEVIINTKKVSNMREDDLVTLRRREIGIVFQFFYLHPVLTVVENVELPMLFDGQPLKERRERIMGLLESVGLSHRHQHKPHELSGGEQQRVGIARALANNPSILLADEPTGNLDGKTANEILNILHALNKEPFNKTIIMVSHDNDLLSSGMRLLHLQDGKIESDEIL